MEEFNLDTLKLYILDRNTNFNTDYGLNSLRKYNTPIPFKYDIPNNLRYLDKQSQSLMRAVNREGYTISEKIATAFLYRVISNLSVVKRYTDYAGIIDYSKLRNLKNYLNRNISIRQNFSTYAGNNGSSGLTGDMFMYQLTKFMEYMEKHDITGWKLQDVYDHLVVYNDHFNMATTLLYNLTIDLSYIDDLKLKQTSVIPKKAGSNFFRNCPVYSYYVNKFFDGDNLAFESYVIDWYSNQMLSCNHLKPIVPTDVLHLCLGMTRLHRKKHNYRERIPHRAKNLNDLLVPRSIIDYYEDANR